LRKRANCLSQALTVLLYTLVRIHGLVAEPDPYGPLSSFRYLLYRSPVRQSGTFDAVACSTKRLPLCPAQGTQAPCVSTPRSS